MSESQKELLDAYVVKNMERKSKYQQIEALTREFDRLRTECESMEKTIRTWVGPAVPVKYASARNRHFRITEKSIEEIQFEP